MIIEGNEKECAAMQEFHKGNRQEGLRLQEKFASEFRREYADKDHCPCQKLADTTETAKNVLLFTEHIRSMFRIVCAQCSIRKSKLCLN